MPKIRYTKKWHFPYLPFCSSPFPSSLALLSWLFSFSPKMLAFFPSRAGKKESRGRKEQNFRFSPFLFRVDVKGFFLPFPPLLSPPALLSWKQDKRNKIQALKEENFVFLFFKRTTTMLSKDSKTLSFQRPLKGCPEQHASKRRNFLVGSRSPPKKKKGKRDFFWGVPLRMCG